MQEVQLEQFYAKLRDDLQVTRLSHFDFVKSDDLEKIGMSRPSARRLIDACKKRKSTLRKKSIFHRILGSVWRDESASLKCMPVDLPILSFRRSVCPSEAHQKIMIESQIG